MSAFVPLSKIKYSKDGFTDPLSNNYSLSVTFKDQAEGANFIVKSRQDDTAVIDGYLHTNDQHAFALRNLQSASSQGINDKNTLATIPKVLDVMNGDSITYFLKTLKKLSKANDALKRWRETKSSALKTIDNLNHKDKANPSKVDVKSTSNNFVHD